MKNIYKLFIAILTLQLTACVPLWKIKFNNQFNFSSDKIAFIKINGIECEFCAKSAIDEILKISGVTQARILDYNYNKENNPNICNKKIELVYSPNKISSINELKKEIDRALNKKDFKLDSIL